MPKLACFALLLLLLSCTRDAGEPCCPAGAFCRADESIFQDAQCTEPVNNTVSCVQFGDGRCHRACLVDADCVESLAAVDEYSPDGGRRGSPTPFCVNVNFYANQTKPCLYPKQICMADRGDAGTTCPL